MCTVTVQMGIPCKEGSPRTGNKNSKFCYLSTLPAAGNSCIMTKRITQTAGMKITDYSASMQCSRKGLEPIPCNLGERIPNGFSNVSVGWKKILSDHNIMWDSSAPRYVRLELWGSICTRNLQSVTSFPTPPFQVFHEWLLSGMASDNNLPGKGVKKKKKKLSWKLWAFLFNSSTDSNMAWSLHTKAYSVLSRKHWYPGSNT